ncbi:MAG: hypothetical protein CMF61_00360 [Magnetococcales bacterium]|nr:hypothetical protein [Magnetococcales bacterium]|tara:strand:- start:579 stop:1007 length:429 start_codon:yes stop_codon:yes gene_type:complete
MRYNSKSRQYESASTYQRSTFGNLKARNTQSSQYEHLASVVQEMSPDEVVQKPVETALERDFRLKKTEIMKELRHLVLKDPAMNRFRSTGSLGDLAASSQLTEHNKRKWALLLKYADVWDDDLKNLGYLELKKIYALTKFNG